MLCVTAIEMTARNKIKISKGYFHKDIFLRETAAVTLINIFKVIISSRKRSDQKDRYFLFFRIYNKICADLCII